MQGYIKLHRQLLEWEWYKNIPVRILFEHCLLRANHIDKKWQGQTIKRGSFVTGRKKLAQETGLTIQQIRTALSKLKSTNEITCKTTSQYSIISINNWDRWQADNQQPNQQITNEQPATNQQITTNKNDKNDKNEKNIYKEQFKIFWEKYPKKVDEFKTYTAFYSILTENIADFDELQEGVERYSKYVEEAKIEPKFITTPSNWLKNRKWKDEYTGPPAKRTILERLGMT